MMAKWDPSSTSEPITALLRESNQLIAISTAIVTQTRCHTP
jgi:hypothetical protein